VNANQICLTGIRYRLADRLCFQGTRLFLGRRGPPLAVGS
jgi:hypothetical protein